MEVSCGCKGIRTCKVCEESGPRYTPPQLRFYFCHSCGLVNFLSHECAQSNVPVEYDGVPLQLPGINLYENFVSEEEEDQLLQHMDQLEWKLSQSGRRKQDFGPQVNFKKKKWKFGGFIGLPLWAKLVVDRMHTVETLKLCNLDYESCRGSAIEPHKDDDWLWGERLITLNLLADTFLCFTREKDDAPFEVAVPLPRRSLIVVSGQARYEWLHAIHRRDVPTRRIAMTFRELSEEVSLEEHSRELVDVALSYQGVPC